MCKITKNIISAVSKVPDTVNESIQIYNPPIGELGKSYIKNATRSTAVAKITADDKRNKRYMHA